MVRAFPMTDSFEPTGAFGATSGGDLGEFFRVFEPELKAQLASIAGDTEFFYYSTRGGAPIDGEEVVLVVGGRAFGMLAACHEKGRSADASDETWANISWMAHAISQSHLRAVDEGEERTERVVTAIVEQLAVNPIGRLPWEPQFSYLGAEPWAGRMIRLYLLWVPRPSTGP